MSDGDRLRQSWLTAFNEAESHFRRLLTSHSSSEWRRVSTGANDSQINPKGKVRVSSVPELSDVIIHRKASKAGSDIYRMTLDVPIGDEFVSLEPWKAVLATTELRQEWDPAVESAHLVEMFDNKTRVCKTNFTLGWPANPRDAVTIARSFHDPTTIIDISTSLPRSLDEPAYLRPSPPYVRSNVTLFAWCIQLGASPSHQEPGDIPKRRNSLGGRIRVICFWQHDLRVWNFGSSSGLSQQLRTMVLGLLKTVKKRESRVPVLIGYGNCVTIERIRFQLDREALTVDYAIIPEDDEHASTPTDRQDLDELIVIKEQRRLTRSIECALPSSEGWDVQLSTKASSERVEQLPWSSHAIRSSSLPSTSTSRKLDQIILSVTHTPLLDRHSILKVHIVIELSSASSGLRMNGLPHRIHDVEEERDPSSYFMSKQILQDVSTTDLSLHSFNTASSIHTVESATSNSSKGPTRPQPIRSASERSVATQKTVLSRVRRNYIYFSSLLQEPEAKWKRTTEARGVSITQLDSIDPTLIVYRAEATFVGVGLWDLYGTLVSPGARTYWDKQHDDAVLLDDVNELTELWQWKTKAAWPVNGRDSVVLKTVYKSPTTIHVFSFSADDPQLFPTIPAAEANVIRTQVDLQGWAIEALSPTTTLLTLLEQSDPKGWSNKASIPQQMVNSVAGVGEFAIKCGGPPVVTRLAGAKANNIRYDHERGVFRIEYEGSTSRQTSNPTDATGKDTSSPMQMPIIECELRCDVDTWAGSLDIVVDPPPQSVSCLRRHRLSAGGGGLWLTMSHDAIFVDDERLLVIVRKGPGREKGLVMLNGAKVTVDTEELPESEIKSLSKQKRVKPARIPLDQPPVMSVIRKRRAEWDGEIDSNVSTPAEEAKSPGWASAPRLSSPLARFISTAVEQATTSTQQAVAAMSPAITTLAVEPPLLTSSKPPMQYALEVLSWIQEAHPRFASHEWTLVSDKGLTVYRKLFPEISPSIPIHRGQKVIEGVSAEELAAVVTQYDCRKQWDDRFDSSSIFQAFGADSHTAFVVSKGGFPFRDRGFYLASISARGSSSLLSPRRDGEQVNRSAVFCVSASFSPDSIPTFSPAKYNSHELPIGRVFVDAWVFETLDPYTTENYAIPSTRCTRIVAVDYAGSIPVAVNSMINSTLPRSILAIESYMKSISPLPVTRWPASGVLISDKKADDPYTTKSWKLRRRDDNRVLIMTQYTPDQRAYRSTILLTSDIRSSSIKPDDTSIQPTTSLQSPSSDPPRPSTPPNDDGSSPSLASPQPRIRKTSSTSTASPGTLYSHQRRATSPSRDGLKPSSSAFTLRGEVRPSTDLLVAEVIIDSRLYPNGYNVHISSRIREGPEQIPIRSGVDVSNLNSVLPLIHIICTMPSSPLHSSGLNADRPTRHLLRLMLPTAQYQISTVQDPLTGETQSAPPKPQWLLDLQNNGAVIDIDINPAASKRGTDTVLVDGTSVVVTNEKESLTKLGREDLQDDRISKMAVISRAVGETEVIPDELKTPLAISDSLLYPSSAASLHRTERDSEEPVEVVSANERSEGTANDQLPDPAPEPQCSNNSTGGLFGFLNSYPNPLSRFTAACPISPPSSSSVSSASSRRHSGSHKLPPGGLKDLDFGSISVTLTKTSSTGRYTLSTIIIVALIAFLIGSLLRSLLSPADFIYVASDLKDAEKGNTGWREIKRLLEVKYIAGGWDFQVAVVRRH